MKNESKVFKLGGTVQHYAWGGDSYLPQLLSLPNPEHRPFAEYWMGAHDNAPAVLLAGTERIPLNRYIADHPAETLGPYTNGKFGRLPYLLKILDVKDMLSIQVHPSKRSAELEFAAENKKGIALNASDRNYKDDNHKPELMTALSDFWLLHGFKAAADLEWLLLNTPELKFLAPTLAEHAYRGLYSEVMEMPQQKVNEVLGPLIDRILPLYQDGSLRRQDEHFWAARAALTYDRPGVVDRGIFSIYFFNLLNLQPGEAIFQDAGLPHAYLEGQNVEIMANSDNVLRGGLTPKHVDVPELLKHIRFEATFPRILPGDKGAGHITVYPTPAPDFELSKISLLAEEAMTIRPRSVEIFFVMEGKVGVIEEGAAPFTRKKGDSFVAFYQAKFELAAQEDAVVYKAAVPVAAP